MSRQIHNVIKRKIKEAEESWLTERCVELERLDEKHDILSLHKKKKETAGLFKKNTSGVITDKHGNAMWELEVKIVRWKEYIEQLFKHEDKKKDQWKKKHRVSRKTR